MPLTFASLTPTVDQLFPEFDFGHAARNKRFRQVVSSLLAHPDATLPDRFHDPNGYIGCLRLFDHPNVSHAPILGYHQCAVLDCMEQSTEVILIIHDTTELDFSGHRTLAPHLGPIGNGGGRGFLAHHSLAVDPESRAIWGLVNQILHVREAVPPRETVTQKRTRQSRESRLWLQGLQAIGPTPEGCQWIHVADRGADTFEFLQTLVDGGHRFIVRSTHNRALGDSHPEERAAALLHDELRALPRQTTTWLELSSRQGVPARLAELQYAAGPVQLRPPHVQRGQYRKEPVPLWGVHLVEVNAPPGVEPLEWFLLTSEAVTDDATLVRVVGWYSRRWVIEELHKGEKTGLGVERLQVQSVPKLEALIALLSVLTVAIINLRQLSQQPNAATTPATAYVPQLWVEVLSRWRYQVVRPLSVREFTQALGRLGGHLNRRHDGVPGWLTLWRGWERLHVMLEYEQATPHAPPAG